MSKKDNVNVNRGVISQKGPRFMKPYYEPDDGFKQEVIPDTVFHPPAETEADNAAAEAAANVIPAEAIRPTLAEVDEIFKKTIENIPVEDVEGGDGDPVGSTLQKLLAEFVQLETERRYHDAALEVIAKRVAVLSPIILEMFAETGMKSARIGKLTVFLKSNKWCSKKSDVSTEQVCSALKDAGLGYMVSDGYNAASLKSKMKEYRDAEIEPPASLTSLLNEGETIVLSTRKA